MCVCVCVCVCVFGTRTKLLFCYGSLRKGYIEAANARKRLRVNPPVFSSGRRVC